MPDYENLNSEENNLNIKLELEKYKSAFNESLDAIIITDGETGKIIDANNACINILGYDKNELLGRHYLLLYDNSSAAPANYENEIQMFGPVVTAKNIKTRKGEIIPMDLTISTMEFAGHNFVLSAFRDARERIAYETKINKYNIELRELNASKDKFFSIIAHDLKSPLTAVMGYSEILSQESDEISREEIVNYSSAINRVSKELAELLENLLHWSRIQTGRMDFDPDKFNLHNLVDNILKLLSPAANLKNVQLINIIDKDITIYADENMINTVIRNLISNSIKFTETGQVTITNELTNDHIKIIVQDSGIGMCEDTLAKLFSIDKSKSRPGTQNEKGTGLGLILSQEFIKKHNGNITAASQVGKGSRFTITLPIK